MEVNNVGGKDVVAVVYSCPDDSTLREILKQGVFEWPRTRFDQARYVKADSPLFVFVEETRRLWGIYKATQDVQINTSGPLCNHYARVSFTEGHSCQPLPEDIYKPLLADQTGAISFLISHKQARALWNTFKLAKPAPTPEAPPVRTPPPPPPPPPVHPAQHNGPATTPRFYEEGHGNNPMSNASTHPYGGGHAHASHASHVHPHVHQHHHMPMSDASMHSVGYPPPPPDRRHRDPSSYGGPIPSPRHAPPPPPPNVGRAPMDPASYGRYPPPPGPYPGHEYVWDGRGWIPSTWHRSRWENNYWSGGELSQPPPPRFADVRNGHPHPGSDSGLSGSVQRQGSDASDTGEKHRQQQCGSQEEKVKLREQNEALRAKLESLETSLSELRSQAEKNRERLDAMEKENKRENEKLGYADLKEAEMRKEVEVLRSSFAGMNLEAESPQRNVPPLTVPSYQIGSIVSVPSLQVQTPQIQSMMSTPHQSPRFQSPRAQSPNMLSQMPTAHNQSPRLQTPKAQSPAPQSPLMHSPRMYTQVNPSPRMQSPQPQVHHPPQSISPAPQGTCVGASGTVNRIWTHSHAANDAGMRSRNHEAQSTRPQSPLTPRSSVGQHWGNQHTQNQVQMAQQNVGQESHLPSQASPHPVAAGAPSPHMPTSMGSCANSVGQINGPSIPVQHLSHQNQSGPPQISQQQGPGVDNTVFGTSTLPPAVSPTAPRSVQGHQLNNTAPSTHNGVLPTPTPAHHINTSHATPQSGPHAGPPNVLPVPQNSMPVPQHVLPVHQSVPSVHQSVSPVHQSVPPVYPAVPQTMQLPTPFQGNTVPRQQFGVSGVQPYVAPSLNMPQSLPQPIQQQDWTRTPQRNWGPLPSVARPPPSQCGSATPREIHSIGSCPSNTENTMPQTMGEAEEDMYILGGMIHGENICLVEKYNSNGMWELKGELPEGLSPWGGDACSLEGNIFVLGLERQKPPEENGAVHRFDTRTGSWDRVASLQTPRKSLSSTVCNGKVVALGGQKHGYQEASDIVEIYDPERNTWIMGPNMNQARFGFDAVCVASCVFAVGGQQDKNTPLDTVELWDLRQKGWQTVKSMELKRGYLSCAAYGESIFALGGCGLKTNVNMERRLEMQATVETFDPRANKWTTNAPMSDTRAFGSAEYWGGYIWAIGGRKSIDDVGNMLAMERFDIREGKWKSGHLAGSSHKRAFHTTCIVKRMY